MTDTERQFDIDKKTRCIISGARVAIQRLKQDGNWDMIATMQGGGRTIARWCEANDVHPSREAEQILATLPDIGFKERS